MPLCMPSIEREDLRCGSDLDNMRLLKYIIFLETKVLELWTNWEIDVWRSHFFCVVGPLSLLKASRRVPLFWRPRGFHYLSSHGILWSTLKDNVIPHVNEGFRCLDMPIGSRLAGCCTGTTGCVGDHTAPELLPSPSMRCINTATSNQVADSILTM